MTAMTATYSLHSHHTLARETPPLAPRLTDLLKSNPALQDDLDTIIEERLARATPQRGGIRLPAETAKELDDLRKFKQEKDQREAEAKGNYERALKSATEEYGLKEKSWQDERTTLLKDIRHDRVESQLVVEATAAGAINPKAVAKLLQDRVDLDDNRQTIVKDSEGRPLYKGGKLVAVKDLIAQHRRDEPWAYKAEGEPAEGSPASKRGGGEGDQPALGGDANLARDIEDAQKAYDAAHKAALSSNGSASAVSNAKTAKRKLADLLDKQNAAKK